MAILIWIWVYGLYSHFLFAYDRIIVIVGVDPATRQEVSRGMGYFVDDSTVITSAHVVPDDRYLYSQATSWEPLSVQYRFPERDIALLSPIWSSPHSGVDLILSKYIPHPNEKIYVALARSGSIVMVPGIVKNPSAQVIAYSEKGQVQMFSGIILPDIPFFPGDSGAPIFTRWGKLIDVVHVE